jgi:hypothetical protein
MAMSKFSKSTAALPPSVRKNPPPPPIPFVSKVKKMDKVDGTEGDKSEWINWEFLMYPDNPAWGSKYSWQFAIFKDGFPEDLIKWVMAFHEIENLMPMKEPVEKTRMFWTLLKEQALSYFEHHLMRRLEAEDSEVTDNELIELVLRDVGLEYIPKCAIHVQKYYMRQPRGLYMDLNTSVQQFIESLNDLNRYLLYFSEENTKHLDQDEIIEILDQVKDPEWHEAMVNANIDIFEISYEASVSYFNCLENFEKIRRTNGPNPSTLPVDNKKYVTSSVCKSSKNHKGSNMWCQYCDKKNHNTDDCREIAKFKQQKKKRLALKPKLDPEKSLWSSSVFSKKLMQVKGNWSLKRL